MSQPLDDANPPFTPVASLGEMALIDRLVSGFPLPGDQVVVGIGDDAAVMAPTPGLQHVYTTDALVEGVHFDLSYTPLPHLGYKAIATNVSDLHAMNARGLAVMVSLALDNRLGVEALEALYKGIQQGCAAFGVDLIGGNVSSSPRGLHINITAIGETKPEAVVRRSGAKPNDLLVVTGDLGAAMAGLLVLQREKQVHQSNPDVQPDLSGWAYVVERQLYPPNRGEYLDALAKQGVQPHAMMDLSDGLATDIHHLAKASACGAHLYANKLPIDYQTQQVAETFDLSPTKLALEGGEDYELLMAIAPADWDKVKNLVGLTPIGFATDQSGVVHLEHEDGTVHELKPSGWDHTKSGI